MRSDRMKLIGGWQACDALAQISEVLRIDRKTRDFINHGQEVSQRANDSERWSIGGTRQTARGGQSQCVLNHLERHATLVQLSGEQTVRTTDGAARARSSTVGIEKPADIDALLHEVSLAGRG